MTPTTPRPAAPPLPREKHEPGDHHRYRIECEVCGQLGVIRLTVDPEREGSGLCDAPLENGWTCTRLRNHEGVHQ